MTDLDPAAEYEICQRRGHESNGVVLTSNPPQYICRWCGTTFGYVSPHTVEYTRPDKTDRRMVQNAPP